MRRPLSSAPGRRHVSNNKYTQLDLRSLYKINTSLRYTAALMIYIYNVYVHYHIWRWPPEGQSEKPAEERGNKQSTRKLNHQLLFSFNFKKLQERFTSREIKILDQNVVDRYGMKRVRQVGGA